LKQAYDRQRQTKASATKASAVTTPAEDIAVTGEPAAVSDAPPMTVTDQNEPVAMPTNSAAILRRTFLDLWPKLSREEQKDFLALVDECRQTGTDRKRNLETNMKRDLDRIAQEVKDVDEGGNQWHFAFIEDARQP
jgi:hypothetical protein